MASLHACRSCRSSHPDVFLRKHVRKICIKFTGAPMLKCDFNKVLRDGCSPVNLLHIFRTPFPKNTAKWLLLKLLKDPVNWIDSFAKKIKHPTLGDWFLTHSIFLTYSILSVHVVCWSTKYSLWFICTESFPR